MKSKGQNKNQIQLQNEYSAIVLEYYHPLFCACRTKTIVVESHITNNRYMSVQPALFIIVLPLIVWSKGFPILLNYLLGT